MSERDRQRRLHVENRLAELNAKYGQLPDEQLPPWLDSWEGYLADLEPIEANEPAPPAPAVPEPPANPGAVWKREPI